jgi:antitoxin component YwqK of YwqJK toxin-antitoxin module
MESNTLFQKNLSRWRLMSPGGAALVAETVCDHVFLCQSESGVDNLRLVQGDKEIYVHSKVDPLQEAAEWFAHLRLKGIEIIYIYGVGLGYYYDAAKEWLKSSERHHLVFFEPDLQVLHRLLETERGSLLLHDRQVTIYYLISEAEESFPEYHQLTFSFSAHPFTITSLASYKEVYPVQYNEFISRISFFSKMNGLNILEYDHHGLTIFRNLFHNYLTLPRSYLGNKLFGNFNGIPAIICGAGPSLDKNIEVLATLGDRALIFAGGTALNALNSQGVMPHFGVGIDPNRDYFKRLVMNHAYELPFFYRGRIFYEGLKVIHGDKLYITGSPGYGIGGWLEKELGISDVEIQEGFNVLNFSLALACAMGCNPLICVGIDLAYTRAESYAKGIVSHPIHGGKENFRTKQIEDDLITKNDIYGIPIYTLWKWVAESMWYSIFDHDHPEITLINATEGGIGFPEVKNMTLADVKQQFLTKSYAFKAYVHGEIQNSRFPPNVTFPEIKELLEKMMRSLLKCSEASRKVVEMLMKRGKAIAAHDKDDAGLIAQMQEEEANLHQELAYTYILDPFNTALINRQSLQTTQLKLDEGVVPDIEIRKNRIILDLERYQSLTKTAFFNASLIQGVVKEHEANQEKLEKTPEELQLIEKIREEYPLPTASREEIYSFQQPALKIIDPEFCLNYTETFIPDSEEGCETRLYTDGSIKFEQHYRNKVLHGPSTYYGKEHQILAQSWFINGKQEGKMRTYYPDGNLYSQQGFRDGDWEGLQRFFYSDGLPKTFFSCIKGQLHGEVALFYPSGRRARSLYFANGKREGVERLWSESGQLQIEAHYADNQPIQTAKTWHSNGILAKEILYDDASKCIQIQEWDLEGKPVPQVENRQEDYFELVTRQTGKLTESLDGVFTNLSNTIPLFMEQSKEGKVSSIESQLEILREEMKKLHMLNSLIQAHSQDESSKEAIWKNPSTRQQLEQRLTDVSKKMSEDFETMEKELGKLLSKLYPDKKQDPPQ